MDLERIVTLSGIPQLKLTPVTLDIDFEKAQKASQAKTKQNNSSTSNMDVEDVRTINNKNDIDQNVAATLVDTDDSVIDMKDGKTDVNGQRVMAKREKLNYTISVDPKTGLPKVDDELKKEMINVESWVASGSKDCYVIKDADGQYLAFHTETVQSSATHNHATALFAVEHAQQLSQYFANSTVVQLVSEKQEKKVEEEEQCEEQQVCAKCKCAECECPAAPSAPKETTAELVKETQDKFTAMPTLLEYVQKLKESKHTEEKERINNLVAKHARKFNKSAVHVDRKKAQKAGKQKHKNNYAD